MHGEHLNPEDFNKNASCDIKTEPEENYSYDEIPNFDCDDDDDLVEDVYRKSFEHPEKLTDKPDLSPVCHIKTEPDNEDYLYDNISNTDEYKYDEIPDFDGDYDDDDDLAEDDICIETELVEENVYDVPSNSDETEIPDIDGDFSDDDLAQDNSGNVEIGNVGTPIKEEPLDHLLAD